MSSPRLGWWVCEGHKFISYAIMCYPRKIKSLLLLLLLPSLLFHIEIRMFSCRASFVNRAGMTAPVQFTRADIVGGTASIRKSDSYCEMNYFS